ncbi:serine hydrolase [Pseudoflavitalea sp. X16]|uniref:serine hydrolase domain-containing protein n=1 Tax=Paraflavitalea devenefica TaxID=2716334 RepID=UPI00141E6491|nr:serine hydrolase domain-containing protein [Paraflavitalea devenefica]NII28853.1 serine hydrolase [Paraflavitalea devenefica]
MKRSIAVLLLTVLYVLENYAQAPTDRAVEKSLDSLIKSQFKAQEPGIVVLAARKGKVIYRKAFGSANLELDVSLKPDMVFRIGSITKQFTAIGILQLAEQGKLQLSDSVQQYIKDFPSKGHTITIEHLLTHTSGIPDYMTIDHPDPYIERHDFTPAFIINHFKNAPLQFVPGTKYAYTNSGYTLLAYIIEKVSGQKYHDYMRKQVLEKAGLQHTEYANELTIIPGRVNGYTRDKGFYQNTYYQTLSIGYGAGDLLGTVDDLYAWNNALLAGKLVKKETLEKAFTPYRLQDGKITNYGYGWNIGIMYGAPCIKHEGQVSGFISMESYFPVQDVFVAVLTNVKSGEDATSFSDQRFRLFGQIPQIVLGNLMPKEAKVSDAVMDTYTGKYKTVLGQKTIMIKRNGHSLFLEDGMAFRMYALTDRRFYLIDMPAETFVVFSKDNEGKVTGLIVHRNGQYEWKKIE